MMSSEKFWNKKLGSVESTTDLEEGWDNFKQSEIQENK